MAGSNPMQVIALLLVAVLLVLCITIPLLLQARHTPTQKLPKKKDPAAVEPSSSVQSLEDRPGRAEQERSRVGGALLKGKARFDRDYRPDITEEDVFVAHSAPERKNGKPHPGPE